MKSLRSLNPALLEHFKSSEIPRFTYGFKSVVRALACQSILDKLNLKEKYADLNKHLTIVDIFSGHGLFSSMINYELKPFKHIIIEHMKGYADIWKSRIQELEKKTGNTENFILYPSDGYNWKSYDDLIKRDKVIEPSFKDRNNVHDELLIVGNLSSGKFGESLLAQWIMCSVYQNWLQKYGRVRMVCIVPENTAQKFLAGAYHPKRNKSAIKRELFTDTKLIAISESSIPQIAPDGNDYDPNTLIKDQPIVLSRNTLLPAGGPLAVIEIVPKADTGMNIDTVEYILQIFMYKATGKVRDALAQLAPGAETDLGPLLPETLLEKSPRELQTEEFKHIFEVFDKWPFKPPFYDTIDILQEETRNL